MDKFYDPDIPDTDEKYAAVDKYEYAITDNSLMGHLYTNWTALNVSAGTTVSIHDEFEGVIALFDLEFFIKKISAFSIGFAEDLACCLITIYIASVV